MKRMLKYLFALFPFMTITISNAFSFRTFVSENGDTLLIIYEEKYQPENTKYKFDFYLISDSAFELEHVKSETHKLNYAELLDDFEMPSHYNKYLANEILWLNYYEYDSLVKIDLDISELERYKFEQGGCSKSCGWKSFYSVDADFSYKFDNKLLWHEKNFSFFFIYSEGLPWGDKPIERNKKYFNDKPRPVFETEVGFSKKLGKRLIVLGIYEKKIKEEEFSKQKVKIFLI